MDPVTVHFNIFQAGAPVRKTVQVEDPRGTTILNLKQQLFSDDLQASKSVRFISGGKILDDATAIEKLGKEAHIHVSISGGGSASPPASPASGKENEGTTTGQEAASTGCASSSNQAGASEKPWGLLLGGVIFLGIGGLLFATLRRRKSVTMHTSQLLFICAAVWVYLLFFHAIPSLFQALNKLGTQAGGSTTAVFKDASSQSVPAATSAGIGDLMTTTLPPGDASASVLTQRR